ncbi:MAG: molybdopterin biosynthesis protein [Coriobacteriales bacterium]|nr:molybdopterin biosynthesis protein [Coriobacteriales bacterium]
MSFKYLKNTEVNEALNNYLEALNLKLHAETVPVTDALNRITASAVYAKNSVPHYHASAMDGIAVMASVSFGATATTPITLSPQDYIVVDTGDPLPDQADAVIMVEDVIFKSDSLADQRAGTCDVEIMSSVSPWSDVRQIGEDVCAGEMIVPKGTKVTPFVIASCMAAGINEIEVCKKPVVGIIPTGDEIVEWTSNPKAGDIIDTNSSMFAGIVTNWGCCPKIYPICKDIFDEISACVVTAARECDIVLLLAGSSAGRDDLASKVIANAGRVLYHGISIKPGKPAILGLVNGKPVIGTPGYPASGVVVLDKILKPIVEKLTMANLCMDNAIQAHISENINSSLKYEETIRVKLGRVQDKVIAAPLKRGAGVVTSLVQSDGIITIPMNSEGCQAGDLVTVHTDCSKDEIANTLLMVGSHDPLIDELANIMNAKLSSTHVGSMGAIMAAKRGLMHAGGIHLLDTVDGTYNKSYIEKFFPNGGVYLLECVSRVQGIIVAKGNPKGIKDFSDIARVHFINRQKGSGTRILNDYLCEKHGLNSQDIYGYDHEEFTHASLAAQIKSGSADAGMGIYSAAKMFDLDFIEICLEQYDFLIPDYAFELPQIQELLTTLQSVDFVNRLEQLGGYKLVSPGKVLYHF